MRGYLNNNTRNPVDPYTTTMMADTKALVTATEQGTTATSHPFAMMHTMGAHVGFRDSTKRSTLGPHTDNTRTLPEEIMFCDSLLANTPDGSYQSVLQKVRYLEECTRTLYLFDLGTGRYTLLDIETYIRWLKWLLSHWLTSEDIDKFNDKQGGKFNWDLEWVSPEAFEAFRIYDGSDKLIVLREPPLELVEGFVEGVSQWVHIQFIGVHTGPIAVPRKKWSKKRKAGNDEAPAFFRISIYATEPAPDRGYMSDIRNHAGSKGTRNAPHPGEFMATLNRFRGELHSQMLNFWDRVHEMRAWLEKNTPRLLQTYRNGEGWPLLCMDGKSHVKYLEGVLLTLAAQPSTGAMLGVLFHAPSFEVDRDYDPKKTERERASYYERMKSNSPQVEEAAPVVSSCTKLDTQEARLADEVVNVSIQRLHYYCTHTSHESLPCPSTVEQLYSEPYKKYRKGVHHEKKQINLGDCSKAICNNGFGIMGQVHVFPNEPSLL